MTIAVMMAMIVMMTATSGDILDDCDVHVFADSDEDYDDDDCVVMNIYIYI